MTRKRLNAELLRMALHVVGSHKHWDLRRFANVGSLFRSCLFWKTGKWRRGIVLLFSILEQVVAMRFFWRKILFLLFLERLRLSSWGRNWILSVIWRVLLRIRNGRMGNVIILPSGYGVSQAILDGVAKAKKKTMTEVILEEYELPIVLEPIPIFTQSGDDRYDNADKMIIKRAGVLPHALINNVETKLGKNGELLLDYVE